MHVVGVSSLVILEVCRTVTKILTAQGILLDKTPDSGQQDFFRSLIDFGISSVIDFFVGMTIFILIRSKNMQFVKTRTTSSNHKDLFNQLTR